MSAISMSITRELLATYQSVDVHNSNMCTWELFDNLRQVRRLVLEDSVDQRNVLQHLVADLGDVAWLVEPILCALQAALARQSVLWEQVQRRHILQDEVTAAIVVDTLDSSKNAVGVVHNSSASDLRIGDESIIAEIIGSDEDAVNSLIWRVVHELRAVLINILRVCDIGRNLILLDSREGSVDGSKGAWGDIVAADSARYSVVVDVRARILRDVLWPRTSSTGGIVVL